MFKAKDIRTQEEFQFKSMESLVRQYGGTGYSVEDSAMVRTPPHQVVLIFRKVSPNNFSVLARVWVPSEALTPDPEEDLT